jgi:hypothetical protein
LTGLRTKELTPAEFASRFGTDVVAAGSFSYFECDNGIGIIKDNRQRTIEIIVSADTPLPELSPEEELQLLSLVCGDYEEDISIPSSDNLFDYEQRDRSVRYRLNAIWIGFGVFVTACLVIYISLYK